MGAGIIPKKIVKSILKKNQADLPKQAQDPKRLQDALNEFEVKQQSTDDQVRLTRQEQADRSGDVLSNPEARELNRQRLYQERALKEAKARDILKKETGPTLSPEAKAKIPEGYTARKNSRGKWMLVPIGAGELGVASTIGGDNQEAPPEEKKVLQPPAFETEPTQTVTTKETQKTTGTKPAAFPKINLGESQEAKELSAQIEDTANELAQLQDPPMTSAELRAKAYEGLEAARKSRANTLEWAKVFEKLVGALTKFGAAKQGLARNLDMSKAEIEKTDWDSMIDRAFKEYEYDLDKLTGRYDKEDKAKADVDSKREGMTKQMANLRARVARARDIRKREQARLDQRRAELMQRRDEAQAQREFRREQLRSKAEQQTDPEFYSRFTDDPKTARELASAAAISEDALASAFNRASVQENLLPGALDEFQKNKGIFGWGDRVVDTEAVREAIQQGKPTSEYPKQVRKNGQVATVSNAAEEREAREDGWK